MRSDFTSFCNGAENNFVYIAPVGLSSLLYRCIESTLAVPSESILISFNVLWIFVWSDDETPRLTRPIVRCGLKGRDSTLKPTLPQADSTPRWSASNSAEAWILINRTRTRFELGKEPSPLMWMSNAVWESACVCSIWVKVSTSAGDTSPRNFSVRWI